MKYLLDTNICIYAINGKHKEVENMLLTIDPHDVCVSTVTVAELAYGAEKSNISERSKLKMNMFLSNYATIPFTYEDALQFGVIRAFLEKQGKVIGPFDMMIAAQGITNNLTVVTHNIKEFERVPTLMAKDWIEE